MQSQGEHPARSIVQTMTVESTEEREGVVIQRAFPNWTQASIDPFVLLDAFDISPPGGFPHHPHMGFEKVTYILSGGVRHEDSTGNSRTVTAGGAHLVTAGSQIYHAEMPVTSGQNQGIQLWINLPKRLKGMDPSFQDAAADDLPNDSFAGGHVKTVVGAGSPLSVHTPMNFWDITFDHAARFRFADPSGHTVLVYPLCGAGSNGAGGAGDGERMTTGHVYRLSDSGDVVICGQAGFRALVMSGLPHHDPIHVWGPFVD